MLGLLVTSLQAGHRVAVAGLPVIPVQGAALALAAVVAESAVVAWPALSAQLTDEPDPLVTTLLCRRAGANIELNVRRAIRSIICSVICISFRINTINPRFCVGGLPFRHCFRSLASADLILSVVASLVPGFRV